jgi:hypothetical protein
MTRRYKPFLVFNPSRGWAFYRNTGVSSLTTKNIGTGKSRKIMRERIGWFLTAELAAMFEQVANRHLN